MKRTALILTLAAAFSAAHAGGIDALKKFNADTDGIAGTFSQTVKSKKKTQTSGGTFQILRPGLFRWEYTKPYKQTTSATAKPSGFTTLI